MSDLGRFSHFRSVQHLWMLAAVAMLGAASACAPLTLASGVGSAGLLPTSGAPSRVQIKVEEYPLVEQSTDNPTHPQFLEHVTPAISARRAAWRQAAPEDAIQRPNQPLSRFGYRLAMNPRAPFHAYALYQDEQLVQPDILHFWPVTVNTASDDFLLPFETLDGQRLMASRAGLSRWPGMDSQEISPPVFIGDRLAYAAVDDSQVIVQSEGQVLYSQAPAMPGQLSAWSGHWALETDGKVVVDGQSLNESLHSERVFHWQTIQDQPFFFYTKDGLTRMNYAGHSLPYVYDQVVSGDSPDTALFRPGGNEHMVWFFALRDGLWYYVEVGVFD